MRIHGYRTIFYILAFFISVSFMTSCLREKSVVEATGTGEPDPDRGNTLSSPSEISEAPESLKGPTYKNLVDGRYISLESMKAEGYVMIVNFWATWCPPCRMEIPEFIELHKSYKDRKFAVIGVSVDKTGAAAVKQFVEENGINYPVIMNTQEIQKEYELAMGQPIRSIPTTFVINRKGEVASVHVGYTPRAVFEQEIQDLLKEPETVISDQ